MSEECVNDTDLFMKLVRNFLEMSNISLFKQITYRSDVSNYRTVVCTPLNGAPIEQCLEASMKVSEMFYVNVEFSHNSRKINISLKD